MSMIRSSNGGDILDRIESLFTVPDRSGLVVPLGDDYAGNDLICVLIARSRSFFFHAVDNPCVINKYSGYTADDIKGKRRKKKRTYLCYAPLQLESRDPVYAMSKITFSCQSAFRVSDKNAILLLGRTVCKRDTVCLQRRVERKHRHKSRK